MMTNSVCLASGNLVFKFRPRQTYFKAEHNSQMFFSVPINSRAQYMLCFIAFKFSRQDAGKVWHTCREDYILHKLPMYMYMYYEYMLVLRLLLFHMICCLCFPIVIRILLHGFDPYITFYLRFKCATFPYSSQYSEGPLSR